ncbi:plasmid stabilization protein [Streptomyces sp. NPDC102402]|uniref:plasmid stabilization protein n=1 Tax=Streptomyces sp. NPDC102402 TaxID=3366169 RepID=UPI0037F795A8
MSVPHGLRHCSKERGASHRRAQEIAARTVNKERARSGETGQAGRGSTQDRKSACRRGGERPHEGARGPTKDQLHQEARKKNIDGRSSMTKDELRKALGR